jgi:hypothetical protein
MRFGRARPPDAPNVLGSARVSRAGDGVLAIADFRVRYHFSREKMSSARLFRRDAETSPRDACATQSSMVAAWEWVAAGV